MVYVTMFHEIPEMRVELVRRIEELTTGMTEEVFVSLGMMKPFIETCSTRSLKSKDSHVRLHVAYRRAHNLPEADRERKICLLEHKIFISFETGT